MMTWTMFLGDDADVDEVFSAARLAALGTSAALHAFVVLAIVAELPQSPARASKSTIDVTVEFTLPTEGTSFGKSVGELAAPQPESTSHLLIAEPAPSDWSAPDQSSLSASAQEVAPAASESTREVSPPDEPEIPTEAVALLSPPVVPMLEEMLPPNGPPPPTVDAHDFARTSPAPTRAAPSPPARRPAMQAKREEPHNSAGRSASISLGNEQAQRKAEEDYFWQLVRKISQYRYYAKSRENTEQGIVVTRMTIARDGRLLDVALLKSSGFANLDNGVVEAIRRASPFAPLPADTARDQQTFVVPISYKHER